MVYEAREDSYLLKKYVEEFSRGKVLEIGCGSGIVIKGLKNAEGVDIDKESVDYCKKQGLNVYYSDLFSDVKGKFDIIIFNPPYLPQEGKEEHIDLFGGKEGYELIERFFEEVENHLEDNGEILILFSNLTNKDKVDEIINKKFKFEELESKSVGLMEKLYVYRCYR
jgi:release factor glutamine methyltransferase